VGQRCGCVRGNRSDADAVMRGGVIPPPSHGGDERGEGDPGVPRALPQL